MKKKRNRFAKRSKNEVIGIETGLLDQNREEIKTGDFVRIIGTDYAGPVLWNRHQNCYGVFFGLWYPGEGPYDPECYGKFVRIPKDNGMRMELERVQV